MLNTHKFRPMMFKGIEGIAKSIENKLNAYYDLKMRRYERINFLERMEIARSKVKGFFFISGSPKSGTTWLRLMLDRHFQIIAVQEARFIAPEFDVNTWFSEENFKSWTESNTVKYGSGILNGIDQNKLINYFKASMIEAVFLAHWKAPARVIGDKSPLVYCQRPELLKDLFPNSKFINIIRDGRDVAVSGHFHCLRNKKYSIFKTSGSGEQARKRFIEGRENSCDLFDENSLRSLANAWAESVVGGQKAQSIFGENYYQVKYEDLVKNPYILRDIFKFLGVSQNRVITKYCIETNTFERLSKGRKMGEEDPNSFFRKGKIGDWKNYFHGKYKEMYKELNGQLLIELGYEKDNNW